MAQRKPRTYAPTPIASRYDRPINKKVQRAKRVGAASAGIAATAGVGYLTYKNRTALKASAGINYKVAKRTFHKYNMQLPHMMGKAQRKAKFAGSYVRHSAKPFTVGYKSSRQFGKTRRAGMGLGAKNMYRAHKPHVMKAMNKGATAFHSYRRIRRDFKGRFAGSQ